MNPSLQGFRLVGENFESLKGASLGSQVMGLELRAESGHLRLFNPARGRYLPSTDEIESQYEEAEARAIRAETEAARLRAELQKLRGNK